MVNNKKLLTPNQVLQANRNKKLLTPNQVLQTNQTNARYTAPAAVGMMNVTASENGFEVDHIQSVTGTNSASPTITTLQVNPGMSNVFPILSAKAAIYEQYRIRDVRFVYMPTCSTSTPGSVILSPEYDCNDTPPVSLVEIRNTAGTIECSPWTGATLRLDPTRVHTTGRRKFVRDGVTPSNRQNYDMCNLSIATVNNGTTSEIGILKVKYKIDFFIKQRNISTVVSSRTSSWNLSADQTITTASPATLVFDEALGSNALGITNSSGEFLLPKGAYRIHVDVTASDSANEVFLAIIRAYTGAVTPAATSPPQNVQARTAGNASGALVPMSGTFYATSDGTIKFALNCAFTGAAGTLKVLQDSCRIMFEAI